MKYVLAFFATWLTVGAALATSADDAREAMALLGSATEQLEALVEIHTGIVGTVFAQWQHRGHRGVQAG